MAELLLELASEEIPARMQARAAEDLKRLVTEKLTAAKLDFAHAAAFATPRRLALVVKGLPKQQPDTAEERKGPKEGAPEAAIQGFLKSAGLTSLEQAELRQTDKGKVWFAVKKQAGRPTAEVLSELLVQAIQALPWPKSMRWGSGSFRWVRPLTSILARFDGRRVLGVLDLGNGGRLPFGDTATGHARLDPRTITPVSFSDYRVELERAKVILDPAKRRARIEEQAKAAAEQAGLRLRADPGLLDELAGLVEWPAVLMGGFEEAFLAVPPEILVTSMRSHQKYFALERPDGSLANRFLLVANVEAPEGSRRRANIVAGNERVLRARLSDAKFFWDQDRRTPLQDRIPALEQIVFHARLGTVDARVDRIAALAVALAAAIPGADVAQVRQAARLCKADLTTDVVGEFPELQGIMGRYYALADGEPPAVADAIAEHYAPKGPEDRCPSAPVSVAVALAEKLDTLVGFWTIDEKPTGSKDPFALRRAALGVIRLIVENRLRLPLKEFFRFWLKSFAELLKLELSENHRQAIVHDLEIFFANRIAVSMKDRGVRHDLVLAAFERGAEGDTVLIEDDLVRLLARVEALAGFVASADGANLLAAYKRANNILRIEEKKDGRAAAAQPDQHLFQQHEEQALWQALQGASSVARLALAQEDFGRAMGALAALRAPTDAFFDKVLVNAPETQLRANRLALLKAIQVTLDQVAKFELVEG
jgi:glycyl-tRNA synthetase beta chain